MATVQARRFITLHTPLTDKTKDIVDGKALAMMKGRSHHQLRARRLVDEEGCARRSFRQVAGAAFDVFVEEPAAKNPVRHPNVVARRIGAATEAQESVALRVAEGDVRISAARHAISMRSIFRPSRPRAPGGRISPRSRNGSLVAGQLTSGINRSSSLTRAPSAQMNPRR